MIAAAGAKPVFLATRVPETMARYLKALAYHPSIGYSSLADLYERCVSEFIELRPWERGVAPITWQRPKGPNRKDGVQTGWLQVNVQLTPSTAERVKAVAATEGVSVSSVLFTALLWVGTEKHPWRRG